MKTIKVALCFLDENDEIIVKRQLESTWKMNNEKELRKKFNIEVYKEISEVLINENIKQSINVELIRDMLMEIET